MGGSATFVVLASLAAASSVGVGGNMPVDSAVFLGASIPPMTESIYYLKPGTDVVPSTHQYLLTMLSIWWAIGQLLGSLVSLAYRSYPKPCYSTRSVDCMAAHRKLLLRTIWLVHALG